ncbi:MAG: ubiquinone/menaquinone biosynthesis C-methylase UbiE [Flavobacteriales bacterium]|jgi:ubiquinone/menaquinone biosynthesis C-methylase UbiE
MNKQALFDNSSLVYDEVFTNSLVGKAQRKQVWHWLKKVSRPKVKVLELNAGTGEDAVFMLEQGCEVVVTDVSEGMLQVAKHKIGDNSKAQFLTVDFSQPETLPAEAFDVVFSNFGGLNCLSATQLTNLSAPLANRLVAGGRLIVVLMTNNCLWEKAYFLLKGKWQKLNQRLTKEPLLITVDGTVVPTYFYSTNQIKQFFESHFHCVKVKPIGLLTPPSYLNKLMVKLGVLGKLMLLLDVYLTRLSWFANSADHVYLEFEKK